MAIIHKILQTNLPSTGTSGDMYVTDKGKIYLVRNNGSLQLVTDKETLDTMYISRAGSTMNGTLNTKSVIPVDNTSDLGSLTNRYRTVYAINSVNVSDITFKKDVNYVTDTYDYYKFIKNANFATFNYISGEDKRSDFTVGFIANDFAREPVGRDIVFKENGVYNFSMYSYTTTIALALQEAMKKIDNLSNIVEEHRKTINSLNNKLSSTHNMFL